MEEYAIIRRKLICRIAARFPQTIDTRGRMARRSMIGRGSVSVPNSRRTASSTAALTTVAM